MDERLCWINLMFVPIRGSQKSGSGKQQDIVRHRRQIPPDARIPVSPQMLVEHLMQRQKRNCHAGAVACTGHLCYSEYTKEQMDMRGGFYMNELGARLQALRRQANLSQQELAKRLHVSRQSISKWELGTAKPDLDNMIRLSELFGVSLDELVLGKTQNRQEIPQHSAQPVENTKAKRRKRMRLCLLAGVLCLVLAVAQPPVALVIPFASMRICWYTNSKVLQV